LPLHDRTGALAGEPKDRQTGLSQFIVDLSLPGVSVRPIRDLAGDAHFPQSSFMTFC